MIHSRTYCPICDSFLYRKNDYEVFCNEGTTSHYTSWYAGAPSGPKLSMMLPFPMEEVRYGDLVYRVIVAEFPYHQDVQMSWKSIILVDSSRDVLCSSDEYMEPREAFDLLVRYNRNLVMS